ncbi:hypothetical protein AAC978_02045 [Desulfitobacterium sp. THU1]|uniref:hypothetical protein n=1 Tax=Desulfitobacterium sp. THU1 TaxID=3138072 RepID=UPI00311F7BB2
MEKIYECKKCGAHHWASEWEEMTSNLTGISAQRYTLDYCPSCKQVGEIEEIDYLNSGFYNRFWPYSIDKKDLLNQYPEIDKWL